jgi:hypothetical protein
MSPRQRIPIRLTSVLAARLAAKVGQHGNLTDIVRQAVEAYLDGELPFRHSRQLGSH